MAFRLMIGGRAYEVDIVRRRPHLVLSVDGREHEVSATGEFGDGRHALEIAGVIEHFARARRGEAQIVRLGGRNFAAQVVDPRSAAENAGGAHDDVKAPMPGVVIAIHRSVGEAVKRGETVATIESMKLQMTLGAPRDGEVAAILRGEGERFEKDEIIARLQPIAGEA